MLGHTHSFITPYEITLVDLQPYPISTEEPKYVATINISQSEKKVEVNYKDFRNASGQIICNGDPSSEGFLAYPECGPIDQFVIHVLVIVLPIVGIVIAVIVVCGKRR